MSTKAKGAFFLIVLFSICTLYLSAIKNLGGGIFFGFMDLLALGAYYNAD
ncbi:hypothetical protein HMI48_10015 [Acidithiobacillus ferrooxidans]|nr:hypothetical protein [Acidithiobacillus ferrooxidans]